MSKEGRSYPLVRAFMAAAILAASVGLTQWVSRSERVPPEVSFRTFPMTMESWKGVPSKLDEKVFNVLGVEDYVLADYRNPAGDAVNLYVGFYQSQKEGDIIHSPKNCMPGAGWRITESGQEEIRFGQKTQKVARLFLEKGGSRQVVLYWFQSRGRIIASEVMQKIWLVVDSITRRRTDGSFVRLISPVIQNKENHQDTIRRLTVFAQEIKPHLDRRIPN